MIDERPIKLLAYSNNPQEYNQIQVTDNLSEINELLWQGWKKSCEFDKPFIFGYPYFHNPYYPVLLYKTAELLDKDVVFITDNKNTDYYLNKYELLAREDGSYVFKFCIPILIKNGKAEIKLKPKQIPNKKKKEETNYLFEIAKKPDIRKVIFCDYMYLSEALEKNQDAIFPDIGKEADLSVDIGAVFFDNIDLITKKKQNLETFADWTKNLSKTGIKVFIQTINTHSPLTKVLKDRSEGLQLNYNHLILKLFKEQFKKINVSYDLLPQRIGGSNIEIWAIKEVGNLDILKRDLDEIYKSLRQNKSQIPDSFKPIISLKELLLSLLIHPTDFKFTIIDDNGNWTTANIDRYIRILANILYKADFENKEELKHYLSTFSTYYNEIKETNKFGQEHQYSRGCKNSIILNKLTNENNESTISKNLIVFTKTEKRVLTKTIEDLKLVYDVNIYTLAESLKTEYLEGRTYISGLPRFKSDLVRLKFLCKNICLILYSGSQTEQTKSYIGSIDEEKLLTKSKNDIKKLVLDNNIDTNNLETTKNLVSTEEQVEEPEDLGAINDDLEDPVTFENNIAKYNINRTVGTSDSTGNELVLQHIQTKAILSTNCGPKTNFTLVNKNGEYSTVAFADFEVGNFVMKFGSDKEDLLSLIAELYGIEDSVDVDIIRLWKSCFSEWVLKLRTELSDADSTRDLAPVTKAYNEYVKKCEERNTKQKTYVAFTGWVLEKRIGPDDVKDVLVLGLLGNFPNIQSEYKFISEQMAQLRAAHVTVGKKISKIIKYLLSKKDTSNLNYQEQIIYERIHMFKVLSKK